MVLPAGQIDGGVTIDRPDGLPLQAGTRGVDDAGRRTGRDWLRKLFTRQGR